MKKRQGENERPWFRSNRFYNVKGEWFFTTREGVDFGPYDSQQEAMQAMKEFLGKSGNTGNGHYA